MATKKPKKTFDQLVWPAHKFAQRPIPERSWLLHGAIPHPSVGMLYAWRGTGKTYTALDLSIKLASGQDWMGYKVPKAIDVLYVDGEMPLGDLRQRIIMLSRGKPPERLWILASEDLAVAQRSINLARPADRQELTDLIIKLEEDREVSLGLIVLDNWVSLVSGIDENDNTALDPIKEWVVMLRHGERSVLWVHHAGKQGAQRGASAREDLLDYSIKLEEVMQDEGESRFRLTWDKTRTGKPNPAMFVEVLKRDRDGWLTLSRSKRAEDEEE